MTTATMTETASPETSEKALIHVMKTALQPLGRPRAISLEVRPDAEPGEVLGTLKTCCLGYRNLVATEEALKPVIGKLLLTVSSRKLYKPQYQHFKDFLSQEVMGTYRLGRSNCFEAMKIAKAFPSLSVEDFRRFKTTNLLEASKHLNETDPSWPTVRRHAETARNAQEFKAWLESKKEIPAVTKRKLVRLVISMRSQKIADQISAWLSDPANSHWGPDPGHIILNVIDAAESQGNLKRPLAKAG